MKQLLLSLCLLSMAQAQYYVASTVAGNGQTRFGDAGTPAINARLISPKFTAVDAAGNVYVSDDYYHQVFQIAASGTITVAAGNGQQGLGGDGGRATAAQLDTPLGLAVDAAGNLYIADSGNARIRKVAADGTISTVAGNGETGRGGDGGSAIAAALGDPADVAVDTAGNLYICQNGSRVIRQVRADGTITTIAGTGASGFSGDGGLATAATFSSPQGITVDRAGNVYVADNLNHRIRRITPQGIISTVAGDGVVRFAGDGLAATAASISGPADVAIDANNNLYISDLLNGRLRMVNASGVISTAAGGGTSLQNGNATAASLPAITGIAVDSMGRVIVAVNFSRQVRRLAQQTVTTIAGALPLSGAGDNVPATAAGLISPYGVAIDAAGNLLISDQLDHRIRKVSPAGTITTAAGTGVFGRTGDGGPAASALIGSPRGISVDQAGNILVTSGATSGVRRIAADGTVTTVAGTGSAGYSGDGTATGTQAALNTPRGVVADVAGNVLIADTFNNRIRRVDATTRIITSIAGTGVAGFSGDDGPAISAQVRFPRQLILDRAGNLLFADTSNNRVRRISPAGMITTVAGNGGGGFSGDGGPATAAQIGANSIVLDAAGNLYIAGPTRIRKVDAATGIITTIGGTGTAAFGGDGGLGTSAAFDNALGIAVDGAGSVYFTDERNARVRKLTPAQIVPEGVANAGTLRAGAVAPGEIISIFGFGVGPAVPAGLQLDSAGRVATQLGGTQVLFDGVAAPLVYVSATQVNAIVPYAVRGPATTRVQVIFQGRPTNTISLPVVASAPGVFGITNADGGINMASNPSEPGGVLVLYGTGEGQTVPAGVDGAVATSVFPKPVLPVTVQVGGQTAEILYAGAAPGFVSGVLQVNFRLPEGVNGTAPLLLKIGEATTPAGVNVFVKAP